MRFNVLGAYRSGILRPPVSSVEEGGTPPLLGRASSLAILENTFFLHHSDFLADPRRGSPHSRGAAVDLTLIDDAGRELDMGTPFDAFTPRSHHGNLSIGVEAQRNRALLIGLMTTADWDFYRNEWWHYQLFYARRYPVLSDSVLPDGMM